MEEKRNDELYQNARIETMVFYNACVFVLQTTGAQRPRGGAPLELAVLDT